MIPKQINHRDVLRALKYISANGYPLIRKSRTWDLHYEGELYPPKYVISKAAEFSSYGKFFFQNQFDSGDARNYLHKIGFEVKLRDKYSDIVVLDDFIPKNKTVTKTDLRNALKKFESLANERKSRIIEQTNRGDTPLVKLIKKLYGYKCQMPSCKALIKKKNGEIYCEVAHITPYSKTKSSHPINLVVLCPNHHKEFDLGALRITFRNNKLIKGVLNGKKFQFKLK